MNKTKKLTALMAIVTAISSSSYFIARGQGTQESVTLQEAHESNNHGSIVASADIRGSMTLNQISDIFDISVDQLIFESHLPKETATDVPLRDIKEAAPEFAVQTVRDAVERILNPEEPSSISLDEDELDLGIADNTAQTHEHNVQLSPNSPANSIRGSMTLQQIASEYNISIDTLVSQIGLAKDVPTDVRIGDLKTYDETFSVQAVRVAVDALITMK